MQFLHGETGASPVRDSVLVAPVCKLLQQEVAKHSDPLRMSQFFGINEVRINRRSLEFWQNPNDPGMIVHRVIRQSSNAQPAFDGLDHAIDIVNLQNRLGSGGSRAGEIGHPERVDEPGQWPLVVDDQLMVPQVLDFFDRTMLFEVRR